MFQEETMKRTIFSVSTVALSPFVYGACISTIVILGNHISTLFKNSTNLIYRDFSLLLFGGAFISNIVASSINLEKLLMIKISSVLFMVGLGMHWIPYISAFYLGRFFVGLAAGIQSNAVPCYISSIAPPKYRGTLTSLYGVSIIGGIILGYALAIVGLCVYTTSALLIILCIYQLVMFNRCTKLASPTSDGNTLGFFEFLLNPYSRRSLVIITMFHFGQHLSGINHILLNASTIFPKSDALVTILQLCFLALVASIASSYLYDRFGRAPLTFVSCSLMISSCLAFYFAFATKLFAILFIIGYNIAISNIPFVLIG
ncbi:hypothetical protein PAEPH01_1444, partial [Pancytospora epiphaga]